MSGRHRSGDGGAGDTRPLTERARYSPNAGPGQQPYPGRPAFGPQDPPDPSDPWGPPGFEFDAPPAPPSPAPQRPVQQRPSPQRPSPQWPSPQRSGPQPAVSWDPPPPPPAAAFRQPAPSRWDTGPWDQPPQDPPPRTVTPFSGLRPSAEPRRPYEPPPLRPYAEPSPPPPSAKVSRSPALDRQEDRFDQEHPFDDRRVSSLVNGSLVNGSRVNGSRGGSWDDGRRDDGRRDDRGEWRPQDGPPADRQSLAREVLRTMRTRNLVTSLVIPIMVAIAVGVAVVVVAGANNGSGTLAPPALSAGFPPARTATADFTATPSLAGRGTSLPLTQVATVGSDIVAVGAQVGGRVGRVRFLFSGDNGHTWHLASVQGAGGTVPAGGQGPVLVAGGAVGWVAISPNSSFTSQNGTAWTSHPALPEQSGDTVSAVVAAGAGFMAAGQNGPATASSPVIWLSATGASWRRLGGAQLSLPVPAGTRILGLTQAVANGTAILLTGRVTSATGQASAAWRSTDGGATWAAVTVPDDAGAATMIAGVASLRNEFVAVRTARVNGVTGALVYTSPDGAAWTKSATITTADGAPLTIGQVGGGAAGAVIEGSARGFLIAFLSVDGKTWLGTNPLGVGPDEQVGAVAVTSAGQAVVAGSAGGAGGVAADSQPVLTLIGTAGGPDQVDVAAIAGVTQPQVAVNAIAASGATQVAVGSADGFPAAWSSADGGSTWARGTQATANALTRAGLAQLTGVTHGPAGWVAVGNAAVAGSGVAVPGHPVVVGSADGRAWAAEDGTAAFAATGLVASAVAASGTGYVIVGWQAAGGHAAARAWSSAGLAGWRSVPVPAAGGDTRLYAVAATGGGFVSVGEAGTHPAAWISPTGTAWRQVTLALPGGAASAALTRAAANGNTVAAVGTEVTTAGQRLPFAAMSADGGATWLVETLPAPAGAASANLAVTALAAAGTGFVATGTTGAPGTQDVVIWVRNPVAGGGATSGTWMAVAPAVTGLSGAGAQVITALAPAGSTLTGAGFSATQASEAPTIWQSPIRG